MDPIDDLEDDNLTGPVWTDEPWTGESGLQEGDLREEAVPRLSGKNEDKRGVWRANVGTKAWRDIPDPEGPTNQARLYIVFGVLAILVILMGSYIILGYRHLHGVDDVIKLLSPSMSMTATILGAAVAFYFSQRK